MHGYSSETKTEGKIKPGAGHARKAPVMFFEANSPNFCTAPDRSKKW